MSLAEKHGDLEYRKASTPCHLCHAPTPRTTTNLCDRCWGLERRIKADPEITRKILNGLDQGKD